MDKPVRYCYECYGDIYDMDETHCHHCGAKLNDYSSEDADDGCLAEYDQHDGAAIAPLSDSDLHGRW